MNRCVETSTHTHTVASCHRLSLICQFVSHVSSAVLIAIAVGVCDLLPEEKVSSFSFRGHWPTCSSPIKRQTWSDRKKQPLPCNRSSCIHGLTMVDGSIWICIRYQKQTIFQSVHCQQSAARDWMTQAGPIYNAFYEVGRTSRPWQRTAPINYVQIYIRLDYRRVKYKWICNSRF